MPLAPPSLYTFGPHCQPFVGRGQVDRPDAVVEEGGGGGGGNGRRWCVGRQDLNGGGRRWRIDLLYSNLTDCACDLDQGTQNPTLLSTRQAADLPPGSGVVRANDVVDLTLADVADAIEVDARSTADVDDLVDGTGARGRGCRGGGTDRCRQRRGGVCRQRRRRPGRCGSNGRCGCSCARGPKGGGDGGGRGGGGRYDQSAHAGAAQRR